MTVDFGTYYYNNNNADDDNDNNNNNTPRGLCVSLLSRCELFVRSAPTFTHPPPHHRRTALNCTATVTLYYYYYPHYYYYYFGPRGHDTIFPTRARGEVHTYICRTGNSISTWVPCNSNSAAHTVSPSAVQR